MTIESRAPSVLRRREHPPDVQRIALPERRRRGRREKAVQREDERLPVLRGKNASRERAPTFANGGDERRLEQRLEGGRLPVRPERVDAGREEDEVARFHGVGVAPREAEEPADPRSDEVAAVLLVGALGRRGARAEEVQRNAGRRARRVDHGVAALGERLHVPRAEAPAAQALRPPLRLGLRRARRGVDERRELVRRKVREVEERGCRGRPSGRRRGPGCRAGGAPR